MLTKIKEVLLSVILPRKMYRYHKLHIFYSLLILIATALVILFSVNLSTERFTRESFSAPDFEKNNYKLLEEFNIPEYKIAQANSGGYYLDVMVGTENTDTYQNVFTTELKNEKNNIMELTIVFDESCDLFKTEETDVNIDKELFDLNAYMMQYRNDSRNNNDKEYLLFVFTKKSFYYLYNLGQVQDPYGKWTDGTNRSYSSYDKTSTGEIAYYIPTTIEEANAKDVYGNYDVSKWTTQTTEGNSVTFGDTTYKAEKRITESIRTAIYNGEYVYGNIDIELINDGEKSANFSANKNIIEVIKQNIELMITSDASIQKSMYSFFAILINVFISFVWVLITWLLSRKFIMNKFKEYYAICAISYIPVSIISCILCFFIRFDTMMLFILLAELIFYIFVTFRINTDPELLKEQEEENKDVSKPITPFKKPTKPNIEFKQIKSDDSFYVE